MNGGSPLIYPRNEWRVTAHRFHIIIIGLSLLFIIKRGCRCTLNVTWVLVLSVLRLKKIIGYPPGQFARRPMVVGLFA